MNKRRVITSGWSGRGRLLFVLFKLKSEYEVGAVIQFIQKRPRRSPFRSPLAPLVGNAALSGECRVPTLRKWRTRHSKRTPLRGPLSAALA